MSAFKVDGDCFFIYNFILLAFAAFRECISGDFHHCDFSPNTNAHTRNKNFLLFVELSGKNTINMLYNISCFNMQRFIIALT